MIDVQAVNQATERCLERGIRVLNAHLFAETEAGHVARLLELMDPPAGAVVLDAGCGVGEVARLMAAQRPDLTFKLLNISEEQLGHCPDGMQRLQADFNKIPLADESVDVVMFNYAICHSSDWLDTLAEACRVLREGGILFINDMARSGGDNVLMEYLVQARAHSLPEISDVARRAGLVFHEGHFHEPVVQRLRDVFEPQALYDLAFDKVQPITMRFLRQTIADPIESAFARHDRIGFQFSGGRDSTAALYQLRPYWDRMTVYHLDTGDQFPETRDVVAQVERDVPIVRIAADVKRYRREHGLASDLVPVDNVPVGRMVSGRAVKIVARYECCYRNLMEPMQARMRKDGITLLVRGQRDDEYDAPPMRSGQVKDGMEVLYPIQSWSGAQVSAYLKEKGLPIAPFYERGARRAPECMGCTAWWDEGRAEYLRDHHPVAFVAYQGQMAIVRGEIDRQYGMVES